MSLELRVGELGVRELGVRELGVRELGEWTLYAVGSDHPDHWLANSKCHFEFVQYCR